MKFQSLFPGKNMKDVSSAKFLQRVVTVKNMEIHV